MLFLLYNVILVFQNWDVPVSSYTTQPHSYLDIQSTVFIVKDTRSVCVCDGEEPEKVFYWGFQTDIKTESWRIPAGSFNDPLTIAVKVQGDSQMPNHIWS